MKKNLVMCSLVILLAGSSVSLKAQDVRAADYQSLPLVMNPALAGNFEGLVRISAFQAMVSDQVAKNNYTNLSADFKLGKMQRWSSGINYFSSGEKDYQVKNKVLSLSLARQYLLDPAEVNTLRVGLQAAYTEGRLDETRPDYSVYTDVGGLRIPSAVNRPNVPLLQTDLTYMNFGAGVWYKYENRDLKFESGFAVFNFFQPKNSPFFENAGKRLRASIQNHLTYEINYKNTLRINYLIWQERLFLVGYNPNDVDENAPIKEDLFGVGIDRHSKNTTFSMELGERSFKSLIGNIGLQFKDAFKLNAAYEYPLNKDYYAVKHLEFGLKVFIKK